MKRQLQANFTTSGVSIRAAQELGTTDIALFHRKTGSTRWPLLVELQSKKPLQNDQELRWFVSAWLERAKNQDVDAIRKLAAAVEHYSIQERVTGYEVIRDRDGALLGVYESRLEARIRIKNLPSTRTEA